MSVSRRTVSCRNSSRRSSRFAPSRWIRIGSGLAIAVALLMLSRGFADAAGDANPGNDPNAANAALPRYLGFTSTDKPIYRAGDKVYIRGVVLNADTHKPLPADQQSNAQVQITGPKGETLFTSYTNLQDSVAAMAWQVPDGASGGQYTATVSFPQEGFPPAIRKFEVRAYRAPRLKGEIIYLRDGYGAGDTVKASLHVERAEGGIPAGADVSANAIVDGADAFTGTTKIDASGNCEVEWV